MPRTDTANLPAGYDLTAAEKLPISLSLIVCGYYGKPSAY
jgi:hypothetical protein